MTLSAPQPPATPKAGPTIQATHAGYVWSERLELSCDGPDDSPASCPGLVAVAGASPDRIYAVGPVGRHLVLWELQQRAEDGTWLSRRAAREGVPPPARHGYALTSSRDSLFVVGGSEDSALRNDIFLYNTQRATWSMVAAHSNPVPQRSGHAVAGMGPRIYILGGEGEALPAPPAAAAAPEEQEAPPPPPSEPPSAKPGPKAELKVEAEGGGGGGGAVGPAADGEAPEELRRRPTNRAGLAAKGRETMVVRSALTPPPRQPQRLGRVGSRSSQRATPAASAGVSRSLLGDVWCLDLEVATLNKVFDDTDHHPPAPPASRERPSHGSAGATAALNSSGGGGGGGDGDCAASVDGAAAVPPRRKGHSAVPMGDSVIVFGGEGADGSCLSDLWRFDPRVGRWTRMRDARRGAAAPWPGPRAAHAAVALSRSQLLLFGGRDGAGRALGDVWVLGIGPDPQLGLSDSDAMWLRLGVPKGQRLRGSWVMGAIR
ncbi:hypothetical protein GPECTOR_1g508 [Gonium pectorale]|uniref:Uncharacterized protein n=1 Tax=Gonium pectorale TaxID=33097 RepID=A0A150H318_GONPE|nr:hypothetical protein GPECTOR_1g508 [Gonium pectorale]|eukprot:KXZ56566.1 hypothetical protein GPECTOR_1g508 [Gonium pectorale]